MSEPLNQPPTPHQPDDERWARETLGKLALAAVTEQRRSRRWGIFFKLLFFLYLVVVLALIYNPADKLKAGGSRHTALINMEGLIASGTDASAENVIAGLRAAFDNSNTAGVILHANSPGGSPAQSGEIYDEILRLRATHPAIPLYTVATDVCASGCYYVAAATQKIYANRATIVGSIGVRADGFGFEHAMEKLGVTRRSYTAGSNKAFLDPFQPPRDADIHHIQGILNEIHQQFIDAVRKGRGKRLREDPDLFSGLIWTGEKGIELGLVDELADVRHVAKDIIGAEKLVDYTHKPNVVERLFDGAETRLGGILSRAFGLDGAVLLR